MAEDKKAKGKRPAVEWLVAAFSLLITLALIGFVAWQAFQDPGKPPQIEVHVNSITVLGDRYHVAITARNLSSQTAAEVNVEGTLALSGHKPEKSTATFNYVPGKSQVGGGLYFDNNPAAGRLVVRSTGYRRP